MRSTVKAVPVLDVARKRALLSKGSSAARNSAMKLL
jgi:hypothetical protein